MEGTGVSLWREKRRPYGWDRGVTIEGTGVSLLEGLWVSVGRGQGSPHREDRTVPTEGAGVSL